MRNGFLCCVALLLGGTTAHAQQFPAYGLPRGGAPMPYPPGYPAMQSMPHPGMQPMPYPGMQPMPYPMPAARPMPYPGPGAMPAAPFHPASLPGYAPQMTGAGSAFIPYPAAPQPPAPAPVAAAPVAAAPVAAPTPVAAPAVETKEVKAEKPVSAPAGETAVCPDETFVPPLVAEPQVVLVDSHGHKGHDHAPPAFHRSRHEHCWLFADYLLAWTRNGPLNTPLVTRGFPGDPSPGALGQPGTSTLFGNDDLDFGTFSGFRLGMGVWLDHDNRHSLDVSGFWLPSRSTSFLAASNANGNPLLARPVFDAVSGQEASFLVSFPDLLVGSTSIVADSALFGGEINHRWHFCCCKNLHLEGLLGFRVLHLDEDLVIQDRLRPLDDNVITFRGAFVEPGSVILGRDAFDTSNTFYGFQLGGSLRYQPSHWCSVDLFGKVGLGATRQRVDVSGSTTLVPADGAAQVEQGGILALSSNIGEHTRTVFGVVPEWGLLFGLDATEHLRLRAGYSFLYWNRVARPGGQIDRTVNPSLVPTDQDFGQLAGPNRPAVPFADDSYWVHFFNLGFELHY